MRTGTSRSLDRMLRMTSSAVFRLLTFLNFTSAKLLITQHDCINTHKDYIIHTRSSVVTQTLCRAKSGQQVAQDHCKLYHNNVWHPESLYGVSWLQPTSKVNGGNTGSRLRWSMPTWWMTLQSGNLVSPYHDNSGLSWTIYAPVKGTVEHVERHGVLQTLICAPVVRPKRCPTSSNPALLPSWTVVCPRFTLLMMLLLVGWPVTNYGS